MNNIPTWVKWLIGAFIVGLLFVHPITRPVIIWLLPLGSGWDDLVAMIAFAFVGLLLYFGGWISFFAYLRNRNRYDNDDAKPVFQILIFVSGIFFLGLLLPFTRPIFLFILPLGSGIDDLVFFIALGFFLFFSFLLGWISIPQFLRRNKNR